MNGSPNAVKTVAICPGHLSVSIVKYRTSKNKTRQIARSDAYYKFDYLPGRYTTRNELLQFHQGLTEYLINEGVLERDLAMPNLIHLLNSRGDQPW